MTAMPSIPVQPMTEEQFFAWAVLRDDPCELVDGFIVMQAGTTRLHERVAKRIFALLYASVDERAFDVTKAEFGVRIRPGSGRGTILYPDVLVDRQSDRPEERATSTPIVVVEVLSPSTDLRYLSTKLDSYKRCATLRHYLVLDQADPRVWDWSLGERGWPPEPAFLEGMDKVVRLPAIGASVSLADVYRPLPPIERAS